MLNNNTVCAISTALSPSAISIVRMTGNNAVSIIKKVFCPKNKERFEKLESHTIHYGNIIDNNNEEKIIDDVLVSYMKGPRTYTGEDVIEINCHGGVFVTNEVLNTLLKNGASLAEPGEFTKRAFLNGKLDLSQAEAVMDLINSQTKYIAESAVNQIKGSLSYYIKDIKSIILNILSTIELNIDYPEYDEPEITINEIHQKLNDVKSKIEYALTTSSTGKIIKEGIKTVIVGKPNVGKSSLLNKLLKEERAIVTDIPGTTRDTVEELINLDGIPLKLIDTAGIRESSDIVEKMGIDKSKALISSADLVLAVFDISKEATDEDIEILELLDNTKHVIIFNKIDLESKFDTSLIDNYSSSKDYVYLSLKNEENVMNLEKQIKKLFFNNYLNFTSDIVITNARHKDSLQKALNFVDSAIRQTIDNETQDLISINLSAAINELNEITGESVSEEIVNAIFHNFCVGK